MSNQEKDTIYVDAEDDITVVIDKVRASSSKIVALVLPKRATTFQSIVNLKLLKRTSSEAKKNIVLITSESGLLPIAGAVGLHVAKTLQSKPLVPAAPALNNMVITEEADTAIRGDKPLDLQTPIGVLAGHVAAEETIELDNEAAAVMAGSAAAAAVKKPARSLSKKLKVPDFDRFRLMLFGGAGFLILLIVFSVFALVILPKAKITIKTDTSTISTDLNITAKTDAKNVDVQQLIIPAISKELKKTDTEKTPSTGQRNEGTKAEGKVTLTLTDCSQPLVNVPAGTGVSASSLTFITSESATLVSTVKGGKCSNEGDASATVAVVAQKAGDNYNLGARNYSVAGFSNVSGTGSTMAGGTSKIIQIVSQQDVDNAKQKIIERLNGVATAELKSQFITDNAQPLTDTFTASSPTVVSTPNVNDVASEVSVSVSITYTQIGVKQADLKQLVENDIKKRIDASKQTIQDNGIEKATIQLADKKMPNQATFNIKTFALAGPKLDADGIKKDIAGKKRRQSQSIIEERPGIQEVEIKYSPFWVQSTPKSTKKITVVFDQNDANK